MFNLRRPESLRKAVVWANKRVEQCNWLLSTLEKKREVDLIEKNLNFWSNQKGWYEHLLLDLEEKSRASSCPDVSFDFSLRTYLDDENYLLFLREKKSTEPLTEDQVAEKEKRNERSIEPTSVAMKEKEKIEPKERSIEPREAEKKEKKESIEPREAEMHAKKENERSIEPREAKKENKRSFEPREAEKKEKERAIAPAELKEKWGEQKEDKETSSLKEKKEKREQNATFFKNETREKEKEEQLEKSPASTKSMRTDNVVSRKRYHEERLVVWERKFVRLYQKSKEKGMNSISEEELWYVRERRYYHRRELDLYVFDYFLGTKNFDKIEREEYTLWCETQYSREEEIVESSSILSVELEKKSSSVESSEERQNDDVSLFEKEKRDKRKTRRKRKRKNVEEKEEENLNDSSLIVVDSISSSSENEIVKSENKKNPSLFERASLFGREKVPFVGCFFDFVGAETELLSADYVKNAVASSFVCDKKRGVERVVSKEKNYLIFDPGGG